MNVIIIFMMANLLDHCSFVWTVTMLVMKCGKLNNGYLTPGPAAPGSAMIANRVF